MGSAHIPPPREDDPEEVADKLSIAAAMWARGETHDALQWLRRAAESASDADADLRALELAKAAAELANAAPSAPAAAPASSGAQPAARPLQTTAPTGVKPTTSSSALPPPKTSTPPVKPASRPAPPKPSMRPGGPPAGSGKLNPLPPLRPLGSAAPAPKTAPRRPESGAMSAVSAEPPPPAAAAPAAAAPALASLIDEHVDHDETSVMPIAEAQSLARHAGDGGPGPAPSPESDEADHLSTMRRDEGDAAPQARRDDPIHVAETMDPSNPIFAHGHAPAPAPSDAHVTEPLHTEPALPLAVGIRVRVFATEGGAWIVPEHEGHDGGDRGGTLAILVPMHAGDDLRSVFTKK